MMLTPARKPRTGLGVAINMAEVVYHATVRSVRKTHNNAFMAIALNLLQTILLVLAFFLMFSVLGMRGAALRGDFLMYLMSGVFLFMTHTKTLGAVVGSEGPSSPMMQHAPMNTIVSIMSAAIGALYIQVLSLIVILFVYHVAITPFDVEKPFPAFGMLMLCWFTGVALGVVLLSLKPWFPGFVGIFTSVYQRANMIASGKMFVANTLPGFMLPMFTWNPLFHAIDQNRGFVFLNYNPRYTSWDYPLIIGVVFLMIGMMGEFYTRKNASVSWGARR